MGEIRREVKTFEISFYCDIQDCQEKMVYQASFDKSDTEKYHECFNGHHVYLPKRYPFSRKERVF